MECSSLLGQKRRAVGSLPHRPGVLAVETCTEGTQPRAVSSALIQVRTFGGYPLDE